jgi:hypothetical protein
MPRVTIEIEPDELALISEGPQLLGLDGELTVAERAASIFRAGLDALAEQQRRALRLLPCADADCEVRAVAADDHAS